MLTEKFELNTIKYLNDVVLSFNIDPSFMAN